MHLIFEKDTRYYVLLFQRGLFGWALMQEWGRLSARHGRHRITPCQSYEDGKELLRRAILRRHQRGYRLVQGRVPD